MRPVRSSRGLLACSDLDLAARKYALQLLHPRDRRRRRVAHDERGLRDRLHARADPGGLDALRLQRRQTRLRGVLGPEYAERDRKALRAGVDEKQVLDTLRLELFHAAIGDRSVGRGRDEYPVIGDNFDFLLADQLGEIERLEERQGAG